MCEDLCQIWSLFLKYHTSVPIADFEMRLGRIALSKQGKSVYVGAYPPGYENHALQESDRRKRLDLR